MKLPALILPLLLLAGCGVVDVQGDGYRVRAVYVLKDPQLDRLTVTSRGSRLTDYHSTTRADAIAATGNIVATLVKFAVGL